MKLDNDIGSKVTEPDFPKKFPIFFYKQFFTKKWGFSTFLQNYSNDFAHFWSECRKDCFEPSCQVSCREKIFLLKYASLKSRFLRKCRIIAVFSTFLQNYSNDFAHFWSECREERYWSAEKNRTSKACSVLEIFIHKVCVFRMIFHRI